MNTPDYEDLKREFNSHPFKRMAKSVLGTSCFNCGSSKGVEYHHIVPLKLGGTNKFSNIVPLCHKCHKAAHCGQHMTRYSDFSNANGRPPKCDDKTAFAALDLLADGQIGNRACKSMMGVAARTEPVKTTQYQKWSKARGIERVRSTLDVTITNSPSTVKDGLDIGYVIYADGTEKRIYFHDTGLNDDATYRLRGSDADKTWGEIRREVAGIAETLGDMSDGNFLCQGPESADELWWREYRKKLMRVV